jgi:hypothetical protein
MKTFNRKKYTAEKYQSYSTAPEILFAIEQVVGEELPGKRAHEQWAEPGPYELQRIEEIAWSIADEEQEKLSWGCSSITRNA